MIFQQLSQQFSLVGTAVSLEEVLTAREQRAMKQQAFLSHGETVLSLTLTAVGGVKRNPMMDWVFAKSLAKMTACFAQLGVRASDELIEQNQEGHFALWRLPIEATRLKQAMIELEESSPLARLWDCDVFTPEGELLSRTQFGAEPRACFLCQEEAKICARARKHEISAIQQEMQERAVAEFIAESVTNALLEEVRLTPKPGLVDQANNGAHKDMDLSTFERSASALEPFWGQFVRKGMESADQAISQILVQIRPLGLVAEKAMLAATKGVNTHKGAIFAFGVVCTVIGRLFRLFQRGETYQLDDIFEQAAQVCHGITAELDNYPAHLPLTAGIRLYREFGLTGARGEAELGFPLVKNVLADFKRELDWQHSLLLALLQLMALNDDSNIAHRGGAAGLKFVKERAIKILEKETVWTNKSALITELEVFDKACIVNNLSAGGSADLLALTIFLQRLNRGSAI